MESDIIHLIILNEITYFPEDMFPGAVTVRDVPEDMVTEGTAVHATPCSIHRNTPDLATWKWGWFIKAIAITLDVYLHVPD